MKQLYRLMKAAQIVSIYTVLTHYRRLPYVAALGLGYLVTFCLCVKILLRKVRNREDASEDATPTDLVFSIGLSFQEWRTAPHVYTLLVASQGDDYPKINETEQGFRSRLKRMTQLLKKDVVESGNNMFEVLITLYAHGSLDMKEATLKEGLASLDIMTGIPSEGVASGIVVLTPKGEPETMKISDGSPLRDNEISIQDYLRDIITRAHNEVYSKNVSHLRRVHAGVDLVFRKKPTGTPRSRSQGAMAPTRVAT